MSRVVTPQTTGSTLKIPHEKIAMRAFQKWEKRGRPGGTSMQDWLEAEAELRAEIARGMTGTPQAQAPQAQTRR